MFDERVVASLKLRGARDTAEFIQQVLNFWNVVNVSARGQDRRLRDPYRSVQDKTPSTLQSMLKLFQQSESGHAPKRVACLTHDTRKALIQTTEGLIAVCQHLFSVSFNYVLLRELQSDRIEGEFSVYRQSTGANAFMQAGGVFTASKRRLARFSASFLEVVDTSANMSHKCNGIIFEGAQIMEMCADVSLSPTELNACAYFVGWLEIKCKDDL